jgi:hypothetical protein
MTPAERRAALLKWFYADEERNGIFTSQIMQEANALTLGEDPIRVWLYWPGGRDRAHRDLKALVREGHIIRGQHGGKATWWYA